MSRRILGVVTAVATLAVALFAVPLGVAVARLYRDQQVISLQRQATLAGLSVPTDFASSGDPVELPAIAGTRQLAVYGTDGRMITGTGPSSADAAVRRALSGHVADKVQGAILVVAVPLSVDERVFASVRVAVPRSVVDKRTRRTWLAMAGLAGAAIVVAGLLGLRQSRRLARPITRLAEDAHRLGDGDFTITPSPSGIAEIDQVSEALQATARRLGDLVRRERAFSADASHQLRTPITALRLSLDNALTTPGTEPRRAIADAVTQLDRLENTVEDLLRLARDAPATHATFDVGALVTEAESSWHSHLAASGRPLRVALDTDLPPGRMSASAARQVLDVLIDNAVRHGRGTVTITARAAGTGLVIEVADEGPGISGDPVAIFHRGSGTGHGIGLALARSLAEAEGNRLRLVSAGPAAVFALVIRPA
jgi:signal transduction histidine kinase